MRCSIENLVKPKAVAKNDHFFNQSASDSFFEKAALAGDRTRDLLANFYVFSFTLPLS